VRVLMIAPPWFVVPPVGYGGTEQVVALLTDGLVDAGHEVTLVASGGSRTRARIVAPHSAPPTARLGDAAVELAHVLAGYRRRDAFDLIHDHTVLGLALGSVPGGPPVVHTAHGAWTAATVPVYHAISPEVRVLTVSHDQAARAPAGVRVAGTVHNAIDVAAHPFVAAKADHLAFVGRASPEKGPEVAIEVARRTGRALRMAVKVNEADERAYFEAVLRPALGRADVELVDVVDQAGKLELLSGAAALLFPIGWDEPFGLVPIEAGACGTPVAAFRRGAVGEVVVHGRSGIVVEPGDLDGLCAAVATAVALDPAACRATVAARFDAPRMVADYLVAYGDALAGQPIVLPEARGPAPSSPLTPTAGAERARAPGAGAAREPGRPPAPRP
jgi:glycosyltransferase involved in cell wall biosynthesis